MGGRVSKKAKVKYVYGERVQEDFRLFQCTNMDTGPWVKRGTTYGNGYVSSSQVIIEKETVLQKEWWKETKFYYETEHYIDYDFEDELFDEFYTDDENPYREEEGHYDEIHEREMQTTPVFRKKILAPPVSQNKQQQRALPPPPIFKVREDGCRTQGQCESKVTLSTSCDNLSEEECRSRCLEYSEMVNIFKPLIVQSLLVHDILPYLPFLENHDDIYHEVRSRSPKNAVVSLLNELDKSKELGKWQKFIDALNTCGYTYIVDNIRGYKFISHYYQAEYIKKITPKIGKMIVPSELLPHLLRKDLISDSDSENIQSEDINHGHFAASIMLLDRISRKHRDWYVKFIEALEDAEMGDVASDLKIPQLMGPNRTKVDHYQIEDDDSYSLPPAPADRKSDNCETADQNVLCSSRDNILPPPIPPPPIPPRKPIKKQVTKYLPTEKTCFDDPSFNTHNGHSDTFIYDRSGRSTTVSSPFGQENEEEYNITKGKQTNGNYTDDTAYETYDDTILQGGKTQSQEFIEILRLQPPPLPLPLVSAPERAQVEQEPKFKILIDKIESMKEEQCDIETEVGLLEEQSARYEKMNDDLRKLRELKKAIALKEKEKMALKSDLIASDDTDDAIDNSDLYYPSTAQSGEDENRQFPLIIKSLSTKEELYNDSGVGLEDAS